jgi:guanylate kinase
MDHDMVEGNLFIIAAPSGAGKTSLVRNLLASDENVQLSISYTTRPPRPGEEDGQDYHFVDEATFLHMQAKGDFLESARVYGNYYGTSKSWIEKMIASGQDILLEIDWQGAQQVRRIFPKAIGIYILPPSIEALTERLKRRGQDAEEVIARRLEAAREDLRHVHEFEYVIINQTFAVAATELIAIVTAERLRADKQMARHRQQIEQMLR